MKKFLFTTVLFMISFSLFSLESKSATQLFLSYLENNSDIRKLVINAEKAQLDLENSQLNNSFDINLSTGTINLSSTAKGLTVSAKPKIQISVPQINNLSGGISSDLKYGNDNDPANNGFKMQNTNLSLGIDIISPAKQEKQIALKKTERSLLEAKRALKSQTLAAETQFYTQIRQLLNSVNSLLQEEQTLYKDKIDFDSVVARGFSERSSTYRLAQMKVVSDEHSIEGKKRSLIHDFQSFYKDCGIDLEISENQDYMALIPTDIPELLPIHIKDFDKRLYSKIESAEWTHQINEMNREINKNLSIGVNGGYTFNNLSTKSDSIDAGVSAYYNGINLQAGINVPVSKESYGPNFNFGASFDPNNLKKQNITKQQNYLESEKEIINIEDAVKAYENAVVEANQKVEDLNWNKKSYEESYEMYSMLEKDLGNWYKQGIITESEYLSAKANARTYKVRLIENQLDTIIYNNNVCGLFVEEL